MKVILYTTPNCQPCRATKRWLGNNSIEYEEHDLVAEDSALPWLKAQGFHSAPVLFVTFDNGNQKSWEGFRPDLLGELCASKRS